MATRTNNSNNNNNGKAQDTTKMGNMQDCIAVATPQVQPTTSSSNDANTSRQRDRRNFRVTKTSGSAKRPSTTRSGSKKHVRRPATAASEKREDNRQTADRARAESCPDAAESHTSITEPGGKEDLSENAIGGMMDSPIRRADEIQKIESAYAADDEDSEGPTKNAVALPAYGAHNIADTKPPRYRVRIDSAGVERRELRVLSSYRRADGKTMIRILKP